MKATEFLAIFATLANLRAIVGNTEVISREKRLIYPVGADVGVLVAIAVPLDLPQRSVFVSYNFEANYPPPTLASDIIPGPLKYFEIPDYRGIGRNNDASDAESQEIGNKTITEESRSDRQMKDNVDEDESSTEGTTESTEKYTKNPHKRDVSESLLTRKKIYKILESKLQNHGYRGRACLLRSICESAEGPIHELNGVIGDVFHIILTPSSSVREDIHEEYYRAEELGRKGECSKYKKYCPQCILDYISDLMHIMEKRTLVFPPGSVITFIIAIAIPVDLINRHVFNSFNFAANYGVPTNSTHYTRIPGRFPDYLARSGSNIVNRKWMYRMASNYLRNFGFNGTSCLLRAICEASEDPLDVRNGLHGEILQIILTPSSSEDENLPAPFYEAEERGKLNNCGHYTEICPQSPLDFFSILNS
uniref:Putative secreted protein n=1 Tax=Lutzomyia longipalpis TaxID=7200 RepID=A0A1B0CF04_LUTLO